MNSSILYIASILSFAYALLNILWLVISLIINPFDGFVTLILLSSIPIVCIILGIIFHRKHTMFINNDCKFEKYAVVETLGIIGFVSGLVWLLSQAHWFVQVSKMTRVIDHQVIESILPGLGLLLSGLYFWIIYPRRIRPTI